MAKRTAMSQGVDGGARVMPQDDAARAWTPMSRDECKAALDRLVDAANYVGGGGLGGDRKALGQLLQQMGADHGARGVSVMRELGWQPVRTSGEG